ncbi:hypothetical protein niasHT_034925 [Heterodera trifolii]|uniref:Uncharacterized protein n=1 Tax=Heterodera trifolii TaxID=157864 RepID=A0ABD2IEJ4_9BILA
MSVVSDCIVQSTTVMSDFWSAYNMNHIIWAENEESGSEEVTKAEEEEQSCGDDFFEEVTPELGIYGILLGNIANGEVLYNAKLGHQLKTKLASENEGGIATGNSAYDSAYLVD